MIIHENAATRRFLRLMPPRTKSCQTSTIHKSAKKITPIILEESPLFCELFCFIGANLINFFGKIVIFALIFHVTAMSCPSFSLSGDLPGHTLTPKGASGA